MEQQQQQYGGLLGMIGQGDTLSNGLRPEEAWKAYLPGFQPSAVPQNNSSAQNVQQPGALQTGNERNLAMFAAIRAARDGDTASAASIASGLPMSLVSTSRELLNALMQAGVRPSMASNKALMQAERERK